MWAGLMKQNPSKLFNKFGEWKLAKRITLICLPTWQQIKKSRTYVLQWNVSSSKKQTTTKKWYYNSQFLTSSARLLYDITQRLKKKITSFFSSIFCVFLVCPCKLFKYTTDIISTLKERFIQFVETATVPLPQKNHHINLHGSTWRLKKGTYTVNWMRYISYESYYGSHSITYRFFLLWGRGYFLNFEYRK